MPGKKTASKRTPAPDFKVCNKCGETKPFDLFGGSKDHPHGTRPICKRCVADIQMVRSKAKKLEDALIQERKLTYPRIPDSIKLCKSCLSLKEKTNFSKCSKRADGYSHECKECFSKNRPSRAGSEKSKESWKKYYAENADGLKQRRKGCPATREYAAIRYIKNRENHLLQSRDYRKTASAKAMHAERQKRRDQAKRRASPPWLSEEHIKSMADLYWLSQDLKLVAGQEYHVDHIVPLRGRKICGLHVPWNLQILPADMNLKKSNRYED